MGGLGRDEKNRWEGLCKAKVMVIDENMLGCTTPRFFRESLEAIANFVE